MAVEEGARNLSGGAPRGCTCGTLYTLIIVPGARGVNGAAALRTWRGGASPFAPPRRGTTLEERIGQTEPASGDPPALVIPSTPWPPGAPRIAQEAEDRQDSQDLCPGRPEVEQASGVECAGWPSLLGQPAHSSWAPCSASGGPGQACRMDPRWGRSGHGDRVTFLSRPDEGQVDLSAQEGVLGERASAPPGHDSTDDHSMQDPCGGRCPSVDRYRTR